MNGATGRRAASVRRGRRQWSRPLLTPGEWLDREAAAGRMPARLSERQVAFLVDLIVRVRDREERAAQARRAGRPRRSGGGG
jgi:hypothetical protein